VDDNIKGFVSYQERGHYETNSRVNENHHIAPIYQQKAFHRIN